MGDVYRAVHRSLGRQVALKVIRPEVADATWSRPRFMEEARRVAALSAPGVVTLFDYGVDDEGRLFMAFELLRGQTLDELMGLHGKLPAVRVAELGHRIARVLARVHAEGVLHGDLKPANIMCLDTPFEEDEIKLLDFGLSRLMAEAGRRTGFIMGTLEYMAPEQLADAACDARTDLYGLGGVLHRLVTGASAYAGVETAEIARRKRHLPPPEMPGVPRPLASVLRRALNPRPADRFADAAEMAQALAAAVELMRSAPVELEPPTRPHRGPVVDAFARTTCVVAPPARPARPWPLVAAAAATLGFLLAGLSGGHTGSSEAGAPVVIHLPSHTNPSAPVTIAAGDHAIP
jgi:serine/threonine protein kinase